MNLVFVKKGCLYFSSLSRYLKLTQLNKRARNNFNTHIKIWKIKTIQPHNRNFDQKYKFSNKNDMVCAWRNFQKKNLVAYLHMINETLSHKFHPYLFNFDRISDGQWLTYQVLKS